MVQKNESAPVKKTTVKEKTAAGKTKKSPAAALHAPAAADGAGVAQSAKKKAPVRKKKAAVVDSSVAVPLVKEGTAEKPVRKPRAKTKKTTVTAEAAKAAPAVAAATTSPAPEIHKEIPAPVKAPQMPAAKPAAHPAHKPEARHDVKHPPRSDARPEAPSTPKKIEPKPVAPVQPAPAVHHEPASVPAPVAPAPVAAPAAAAPDARIEAKKMKGEVKINELTTVRDLAEKMNLKPGDLLRKLLSMGSMATINQRMDPDTAALIAQEFCYETKFESLYAEEKVIDISDKPEQLKPRAPVVTIMGHVDHGKTSLLDAIRSSKVAEGEAGGITQHIGAYKVKTAHGAVAFLDTPGHEAFTAMRSRGAQATDIVVLVVSASDGVMPQTVEAIDHARAAGVPIIVAINKIDIPTANPAQIKQELSKYNLMAEDWGGDTIMVEVSAKKNINIDQLIEMILLKAEMMELKANPDRLARGVVIEARLDSRRGPVATILVQAGTLHVGDNLVVGTTYGKIRAMSDEHGQRISTALPSTPVEVLGLVLPPHAGDQFFAVEQEYQAREIADSRKDKAREDSLRPRHHLSLEDISLGKVKELRAILKTDVQGSLEALSDSLERLSTSEIGLKIIRRGVGAITESDIVLAAASDAIIIGFNIRPDAAVERLADQEGVNIRIYRIIYDVIAEVRAAMEGMLEPSIKESAIGKAVVKQVFKVTKVGIISGCMVSEGKIVRGGKARLVRDNVIVYEGSIGSLRRFKDDVKEVEKGFECGISLENYTDVKSGDIVEVFAQEKVARKL